jgi:predicted  nucleic acid-binding Zn-ribbon protein
MKIGQCPKCGDRFEGPDARFCLTCGLHLDPVRQEDDDTTDEDRDNNEDDPDDALQDIAERFDAIADRFAHSLERRFKIAEEVAIDRAAERLGGFLDGLERFVDLVDPPGSLEQLEDAWERRRR